MSMQSTDHFYETRISKFFKHLYTIKPDACLNVIDVQVMVYRSRQTPLSHFSFRDLHINSSFLNFTIPL